MTPSTLYLGNYGTVYNGHAACLVSTVRVNTWICLENLTVVFVRAYESLGMLGTSEGLLLTKHKGLSQIRAAFLGIPIARVLM